MAKDWQPRGGVVEEVRKMRTCRVDLLGICVEVDGSTTDGCIETSVKHLSTVTHIERFVIWVMSSRDLLNAQGTSCLMRTTYNQIRRFP